MSPLVTHRIPDSSAVSRQLILSVASRQSPALTHRLSVTSCRYQAYRQYPAAAFPRYPSKQRSGRASSPTMSRWLSLIATPRHRQGAGDVAEGQLRPGRRYRRPLLHAEEDVRRRPPRRRRRASCIRRRQPPRALCVVPRPPGLGDERTRRIHGRADALRLGRARLLRYAALEAQLRSRPAAPPPRQPAGVGRLSRGVGPERGCGGATRR